MSRIPAKSLSADCNSQFIEMFGNPISNRMRWNTRAIGELFTIISRGKQPVYCEASNIRVINQACVYWDKFNLNNVKYHDPTSKKKTLPVRSGCILINSTGTGTLGRCNVFPEMNDDYTYVIDSHVTMLDGCELINPFFMKCLFQREDVQEKIYAEYVNGSTNQVELSKEKFSEMRIILPPIELQEQFAAFVRQTDKSKFAVHLTGSNLNLSIASVYPERILSAGDLLL